jgi:hypothetical protein
MNSKLVSIAYDEKNESLYAVDDLGQLWFRNKVGVWLPAKGPEAWRAGGPAEPAPIQKKTKYREIVSTTFVPALDDVDPIILATCSDGSLWRYSIREFSPGWVEVRPPFAADEETL